MGVSDQDTAEMHVSSAVEQLAAAEAVLPAVQGPRIPANALEVTYIASDFGKAEPENFGF
jgi:hypothetical protein